MMWSGVRAGAEVEVDEERPLWRDLFGVANHPNRSVN
jgi:hypothetical protein